MSIPKLTRWWARTISAINSARPRATDDREGQQRSLGQQFSRQPERHRGNRGNVDTGRRDRSALPADTVERGNRPPSNATWLRPVAWSSTPSMQQSYEQVLGMSYTFQPGSG